MREPCPAMMLSRFYRPKFLRFSRKALKHSARPRRRASARHDRSARETAISCLGHGRSPRPVRRSLLDPPNTRSQPWDHRGASFSPGHTATHARGYTPQGVRCRGTLRSSAARVLRRVDTPRPVSQGLRECSSGRPGVACLGVVPRAPVPRGRVAKGGHAGPRDSRAWGRPSGLRGMGRRPGKAHAWLTRITRVPLRTSCVKNPDVATGHTTDGNP
jgi:hypothetical protein